MDSHRNAQQPSLAEAFPGTTSLVQVLDKKLLVVLRDGKKLIGTLRTFDQYGNIVLHDTIERVYIGQQYGEQACGIYIIRGENISLLGELDSNDDLRDKHLELRPMIEMLNKQRELIEENRRIIKLKRQIQRDFGLLDSDVLLNDLEV